MIVPHKLCSVHRIDILYVDHQHIPERMYIHNHRLHHGILYFDRMDFGRKHSSQMNIQWLDFQNDQVDMSIVFVD